MLSEIDSETIRILFSLQISSEEEFQNKTKKTQDKEIVLQKENYNAGELNQSNEKNLEGDSGKTFKRETPKFGRNEIVKVTNGQETKEMKFKKAESLIKDEGWRIV